MPNIIKFDFSAVPEMTKHQAEESHRNWKRKRRSQQRDTADSYFRSSRQRTDITSSKLQRARSIG